MPRQRRSSKKKRTPAQIAFVRFMFVVAVFILWIGVIGVRLVHLQVNQHEWLRSQALSNRQYEQKSRMLRGSILDRDGRILAMSIKVNSLYADPVRISDPAAAAKKMSKALNISAGKIRRTLEEGKEKERRFVWLARKLDEAEYEAVNKALFDEGVKKPDLPKAEGIHWKVEHQRSYPQSDLAAQVIGFSDADDVGRSGVERSQEAHLKGEVIKKLRERDRLGRVYEESTTEREAPKDVVLTLDSGIQLLAEQALENAVKASNAKAGKAIVMDPRTGEILAMANYPTFDLNEYSKAKPAAWRNRAVQDNYSPGSVFKMITYGAALEEKLISPDDTIDCGPGRITIAGHVFNDSHSIGEVSFTKALAQSSNVGAIKTGLKVGKDRFYSYARKFGFGERTGVELPAEASGQLRSPDSWNGDSLASMSIGYEIGVSSLQTALAFATIANDGVRVQPQVIKEIRQSDGMVVSSSKPASKRVVSEATAGKLRKMLRQVVLNGTAKRAQLKGYTSAGKTGTAWKYDPEIGRVNREKYVSSFVGFAPANDPRIVVAVVIDEPKGALRNGGQVAAPAFREIAEATLVALNVRPDGTVPEDVPAEETFDEVPEPKTEPAKEKDAADADAASPEKSPEGKEKKPSAPASGNKKAIESDERPRVAFDSAKDQIVARRRSYKT